MNQLRIEALGDCALLIRFGETIDADINAGVLAACEVLQAANLPGVQDIAPAYASVCVRYEPNAWFDGEDTRLPYARIAEAVNSAWIWMRLPCTQSCRLKPSSSATAPSSIGSPCSDSRRGLRICSGLILCCTHHAAPIRACVYRLGRLRSVANKPAFIRANRRAAGICLGAHH